MWRYFFKISVVINCCFFLLAKASAELVFSAPPRESSAAGEELYGPLAEHLSELLGERVSYQYPKNWLQYQRDLRKGVYDIVFDGPHFVSWRVAHLNHEVLVKLPGTLEFIVVVNADDTAIKDYQDLIGKKICAIPPPNLATLTVIDLYKNPVRQPVIWGVNGGYEKVFQKFATRECRAAVFRNTYYYKKLSEQDRANTRVLFKSKPLPNQAMSVSSKINKQSQLKIIRSMTLGKGKSVAAAISKRFGDANTKSFIAVKDGEYSSQNSLLEGIVFGW